MNIMRTSLLAMAAATTVLVPSAAHADSVTNSDPAGDVVSYDTSSGSDTPTKEPGQAEGDIVNSGVVHGLRVVKMAMRYRELTASGAGENHFFRIGTNEHRIREVYIEAGPGHWQGRAHFSAPSGRTVRCWAMRFRIDYTKNVVHLSVPRSCLSRPRWVHVGMGTATLTDPKVFVDDAHTNGHIGENPKWGQIIYR